MELIPAVGHDTSRIFIELGAAVVGLAILARFASKLRFSPIPLYLIAGLAFGNGGLLPMRFGEEFVKVGAEVGVVLLLFMLGLEYNGDKLLGTLRTGLPAFAIDFVLNFSPGVVAALLIGMSPLAAMLMGGLTYISSSGVIARILGDTGSIGSPDAAFVIRVLVLEDLAMAIYLPVIAVLLTGESMGKAVISVAVALLSVGTILFLAVRFGRPLSRFVANQSDEVVLLSTVGVILLVSGIASALQVSAAVGAFLVGVAFSGTLADRAIKLIAPLRDLFAATFFLFFGLQIDPRSLPALLPVALVLAIVTAGTKVVTGWAAAKVEGSSAGLGIRSGVTLIARGEFSIVIAGLGSVVDPRLGPLGAGYVLTLAIVGPLLSRWWGIAPGGLRGAEPALGTMPD